MKDGENVEFSTSGSTGKAKAIVKTVASLKADAAMLLRSFPDLFDCRPYVLTTIREEHMFGTLWRKLLPSFAGCEVHPETIVSVEELLQAASGKENTLLVTTPSFLEKAVNDDSFAALKSSIVGIVTSGSLLKEDLSRKVLEITGISTTEIFGSTETGSVAWRRRSNGEEWSVFDGVEATAAAGGAICVDSDFTLSSPFVMGDAVEFVTPRSFLLLGRMDRNVKVLEKYVSLPDLEGRLQEHPFVAKAHAIVSDEPVPRIRALVELSPDGKSALKNSTYSKMTARLKRDLRSIESFAFPRRIRYLNSFPYNEEGKLVRSRVSPILQSPYQEPVIENESRDADVLSMDLTFIPDAVYFDGHFRKFKILPGVVQLDFAERCVRRVWKERPFSGELSRLKFQRPVLPKETVRLEIRKSGVKRYDFSFKCAQAVCTTGAFVYC